MKRMTILFLAGLIGCAGCAPAAIDDGVNLSSNTEGLAAYDNGKTRDCAFDTTCFEPVFATKCLDGTQTGLEVIYRSGAQNLLIILDGGGACWDSGSCDPVNGTIERNHYGLADSANGQTWSQTYGQMPLFGSSTSPFATNYNIIKIPYCTGDVHIGNTFTYYDQFPRGYYHNGAQNVSNMLSEAWNRFPNAQKVAMVGLSAGGIGSECHSNKLPSTWPFAKTYSINLAGVPFMPQYAPGEGSLANIWSVSLACSLDGYGPNNIIDLGDVMRFDRKNYPGVRRGVVADYSDAVMSGFAQALGASGDGTSAVSNSLNYVFTNDITSTAANYHVFFHSGSLHADDYVAQFNTLTQGGVRLRDWINGLMQNPVGGVVPPWNNVR